MCGPSHWILLGAIAGIATADLAKLHAQLVEQFSNKPKVPGFQLKMPDDAHETAGSASAVQENS